MIYLVEMFFYHGLGGHFNNLSSVDVRAVYEWKHKVVCQLYVWGPVSSIYGVFFIDVRVEGNYLPVFVGEY